MDANPTLVPSSSYTKSQTPVCSGAVRVNSGPVVLLHLEARSQERRKWGTGKRAKVDAVIELEV